MQQYRVVLFDRSTSTEYTRTVQAQSVSDAEGRARDEICDFICEMEEVTDPRLRAQIRSDLTSREAQVSLEG